VDGSRAIKGSNGLPPLTLRDALNKIIHSIPASVEVRDDDVRLHFRSGSAGDSWTEVWFSGTQLLSQLGSVLYQHRNVAGEEREQELGRLLDVLGVGRFLPPLT
jgi:hypothetical protein